MSLFTVTENAVPTAFITTQEKGYMTHEPSLRACRVNYDSHYYHDALFKAYSLTLPEKMAQAIKKRKAEFLASRVAIQALFNDENIDVTIPPASGKTPRWPEGWTGSISHTNECAVVVITPIKSGLYIGIDTEYLNANLLLEAADQFTQYNERTVLASAINDYALGLLITFSGKESLYKAIYPEVNKMLNFDTASLTQINTDEQSFTLELTKTLAPHMHIGQQFSGYYQLLNNNHIITLITEPIKNKTLYTY